MSRQTTAQERQAARDSGQISQQAFDKENADQQDKDTLSIEELATLYASMGGSDPRALRVIEAGKASGHISQSGEYIGPSTDDGEEEDD